MHSKKEVKNSWYPVIDYTNCTECGICIERCPHGVYDLQKVPTPVVQNPESCIDHCHGCGNRCPQGAIVYAGEDTGWIPPHHKTGKQSLGCGCNSGDHSEKSVLVEYLYLDLNTCDRCIGTDQKLEEVVSVLAPALKLAGYTVETRKIEIATKDIAEKHRFISSPTIRVNGKDICKSTSESDCGCCGKISGTQVDCRVFEYGEESFEVPPKEMIASAILQEVFGGSEMGCGCEEPDEYVCPPNLVSFFEGKEAKKVSCEGNCCS